MMGAEGYENVLGKRLKIMLSIRGWRQKDMVRAIGVAGGTVSKWVNEHGLPNSTQLIKIARELDVSTDYLLGLTNRPER